VKTGVTDTMEMSSSGSENGSHQSSASRHLKLSPDEPVDGNYLSERINRTILKL
jgi:hypothetical protein